MRTLEVCHPLSVRMEDHWLQYKQATLSVELPMTAIAMTGSGPPEAEKLHRPGRTGMNFDETCHPCTLNTIWAFKIELYFIYFI